MKQKLLCVMMMILFMVIPKSVWAQEPYAVLSEDNTVLTFYYDGLKELHNGMSVGTFIWSDDRGWDSVRRSIETVRFDSTFANFYPTDTHIWFCNMDNLKSVLGTSNLKTDSVTNMSYMFQLCGSLTSLDLSSWNTQKVTDMEWMFDRCTSLKELNVSGFDTRNVGAMMGVFSGCSSLEYLDVSSFRAHPGANFLSMFYGCSSLTSLDLSQMDIQNQSVTWMFNGCSNLKTIYVSHDWDVKTTGNGNMMFTGCTSLVGERGTVFDADHTDQSYAHVDEGEWYPGYFTNIDPNADRRRPYAVLNEDSTVLTFCYDEDKYRRGGMGIGPFASLEYWSEWGNRGWSAASKTITTVVFDPSFADCNTITSTAYWFFELEKLVSIQGMENLNTANVTDMSNMFRGCYSLTSLDLSSLDTRNVTNMRLMFTFSDKLENLDVSHFQTDKVTDMSEMFEGCQVLTNLDLSSFNTANVTNMFGMFINCKSLKNLDVSNFNTDNVANMQNMFFGCSSLTSLDLSSFNTEKVPDMHQMFYGCSSLTSLDLSGFNTANVTNMEAMFEGCSSLTSLDISNFNTGNVTDMTLMFSSCSSLTVLDLSSFNTENVTSIHIMFSYCSSLKTIYVSEGWSTAKVGGDSPFFGCTSLVGGRGTAYDNNHTFYDYAHIDGGPDNPGYFTDIADYVGEHVATPLISHDGNIVTISTATEGAVIYYTTDGTTPDSTSTAYLEPFTVTRNQTVKAVALREGYGPSEVTELVVDWFKVASVEFTQEGNRVSMSTATEQATIHYALSDSEAGEQTYTDALTLTGDCIILAYATRDGYNNSDTTRYEFVYTPVGTAEFDGRVATVSGERMLDEAFEQVGGRAEAAKTITAIVWNKTEAMTQEDLQGITNPNLLIYVNSRELAPQGFENVIASGVARSITLTDAAEGNSDFYCPIGFTAESIIYERVFRQETETGVSRGWETLVLPFDVQTVIHERNGLLCPFGSTVSDTHFWLRQLTSGGLARATQITANTPYLISMPNSSEYHDEYNLAGRVIFAAEDVAVPATPQASERQVTAGSVTLVPALQRVAQSDSVYALNVGTPRGSYAEGSVFERGLREVRPFECYTLHSATGSGAPRFIPLSNGMGGTTGISNIPALQQQDQPVYDLSGRRVGPAALSRGLYIKGGRKVVVTTEK